jgi:hypothetical protein
MARFQPIKLLFAHDNTGYAAKGPGNENATGRIAAYIFFAGRDHRNGMQKRPGKPGRWSKRLRQKAGYFAAVGKGAGLSESEFR